MKKNQDEKEEGSWNEQTEYADKVLSLPVTCDVLPSGGSHVKSVVGMGRWEARFLKDNL